MTVKRTPQMYARGYYQVKTPWVVQPNKVYTCIAIRSFEDIYKAGEDVYGTYYSKHVAVGQDVNGVTFDFDDETALIPNICTLRADDNELIYIPDTFILNYPNTSVVPYSNIVLGVTLGPLPDGLGLQNIIGAIEDTVKHRFGITSEFSIMRLPMTNNPTPEEHEQLEIVRAAAILNNESVEARLEQALILIETLTNYNKALEQSLQVQ